MSQWVIIFLSSPESNLSFVAGARERKPQEAKGTEWEKALTSEANCELATAWQGGLLPSGPLGTCLSHPSPGPVPTSSLENSGLSPCRQQKSNTPLLSQKLELIHSHKRNQKKGKAPGFLEPGIPTLLELSLSLFPSLSHFPLLPCIILSDQHTLDSKISCWFCFSGGPSLIQCCANFLRNWILTLSPSGSSNPTLHFGCGESGRNLPRPPPCSEAPAFIPISWLTVLRPSRGHRPRDAARGVQSSSSPGTPAPHNAGEQPTKVGTEVRAEMKRNSWHPLKGSAHRGAADGFSHS